MIVRLIIRLVSQRPARASTGNEFLDKLGEWVHIGLYFFAFYILTLGGLIASQRNLIGYMLGTGSATRLKYGFIRIASSAWLDRDIRAVVIAHWRGSLSPIHHQG